MNTALDAARKRLADIEQEAEKLRSFIGLWEDLADLLGEPMPDALPSPAPEPSYGAKEIVDHFVPEPGSKPKRTRTMDNPKPATVIPAVLEILRDHKSPMSRRDIHTALKRRGLEVKGANPVKALGTMLWRARHHDLVSLDGFGYWPKADPYPPARYWADLTSIERGRPE